MSLCVPYCFEHPRTHDVFVVGRASYVPAAFLGSLFVLIQAGPKAFFRALPVNVLFLIGIGLSIFAAAWTGGLARIFLLFVAPTLLVALQGRSMILIVRNYYLKRGWHAHEM